MFANQAAFNDPFSRMQALGKDTRPAKAIVNPQGKPLFYPQTGGMINPQRKELAEGTVLFRFANGASAINKAVTGGWWVLKKEFDLIEAFANRHGIAVPMAARTLCCVPPEWSDMGTLVRASVRQPLLAYMGLGNNVNIAMNDGLGTVKMTAHNNIASLRLAQLYIPGLEDLAKKSMDQLVPGALAVEREWKFSKEEANRGWVYV